MSLVLPGVEYQLCVHIRETPFGVRVSHPVISCTTVAFAVSAWPVAQNCPPAIRLGSIDSGSGGCISRISSRPSFQYDLMPNRVPIRSLF